MENEKNVCLMQNGSKKNVKWYDKCKVVIWENMKLYLSLMHTMYVKLYVKCMLVIWKMKKNCMLNAKL
jgi:hypothetical protein